MTAFRRAMGILGAVAAGAVSACASSTSTTDTEVADWLRAAAGVNETPELIECTEAAMRSELSDAEIREWLSHDPDEISVEEIQALPHAIDVADRCRHLVPPGAP
jgi:hypothetical protein